MATWDSEKFNEDINTDEIDGSFDEILVTNDLQDCLGDSLDLSSFDKVYNQLITFDSEKYSNEDASHISGLPDDSLGWEFFFYFPSL